jgi:hypothetical protein
MENFQEHRSGDRAKKPQHSKKRKIRMNPHIKYYLGPYHFPSGFLNAL